MSWNLVPRTSIGPLRLGMRQDDVRAIMGPPQLERMSQADEIEWNFFSCRLVFSGQGELVEIVCEPPLSVLVDGLDVFRDAEAALDRLFQMDEQPVLCVGLLLFLQLGVALSGVSEETESASALILFLDGRFDKLKGRFKPYHR